MHDAAPDPATPARRSLTDDLRAALDHANGQPITVRQLTDVLQERGLAMVLLILTLPFLLPVPTMGLSAPVGLAIAGYGVCVMFRVKPWLPRFLADRQISYAVLSRTLHVAMSAGRQMEKLLRPRLQFMLWPGVDVLLGLSLAVAGFLLSLPLPIPFSNAIPAAAVLLLLAGLIERDGVFVLAGQTICIGVTAIFIAAAVMAWMYGVEGVRWYFGGNHEQPANGAS